MMDLLLMLPLKMELLLKAEPDIVIKIKILRKVNKQLG